MRYLLPLLILFSCSPAKRLDKAEQLVRNNPRVAAAIASEMFPCKDSIIKGDSVVRIDTLFPGGNYFPDTDTVILTGDTVQITRVQWKDRVITRTVRTTDTIVRLDQSKAAQQDARIADLIDTGLNQSRELDSKNEQIAGLKKSRNWWRIVCIGTWVIVGGGVVLRIMGKLKPI